MSVIVNQLRAVGVYNRLSLPTYTTDLGKLNNISQTVVPSLQLDFTQERLDPRINFTRSSAATRTNAQGLIETTPVNLLTYSQEFDNAAWQYAYLGVTANATTAPDGTASADLAIGAANPNVHAVYKAGLSALSGSTYAFSIYAKAAGYGFISLALHNGATTAGNEVIQNFNLSTGAVASSFNVAPISATITSVGNGWYRCSIVLTQTSASANVSLFPLSSDVNPRNLWTPDGTSGIYIWGAQLEQSSQASTYIPTTASISGAPRFDYDPVTLQPKGLLIEEQRTNLLSASQDFEAPVWTKSNATVNANCVVAPDGTLTGDKLIENTATSTHSLDYNFPTPAATNHTVTVYAKAGERTWLAVSLGTTSSDRAWFNLSSGTIGTQTNVTATITPAGNGWYRCAVSKVLTAVSWNYVQLFAATADNTASYTGNGTSGIYIWGAQLEAGAFATSYVATPISFTSRASTATYRGTNGLIQTAAINTARYEPSSSGGSNLLLESAATNLLTRTEMFDDSAWTKAGGGAVSLNATVAPDGTYTADSFAATSTIAYAIELSQTIAYTASNYTLSCYAKAGTAGWVYLQIGGVGGNGVRKSFNLSTGAAGTTQVFGTGFSSVSSSITSVGNGWYLITSSVTCPAGSNSCVIGVANADSGASITAGQYNYIWGAQLETGSVATSYVPSVETFTSRASTATYYGSNGLIQTAASNVARINYNPANLSVPGKLLLEPAATNLLTYSEQFEFGTVNFSSITTNATTAPDGSNTADKLVEDTSNNGHSVWRSTNTLNGVAVTLSVYVKAAERTKLNLWVDTGSGIGVTGLYDLSTVSASVVRATSGTFTGNAVIAPAGNGWFRCVLVANNSGTPVNFSQCRIYLYKDGGTPDSYGGVSYTGDGTSGIYLWGAQLEAGTSATSYIPTTTAQVTRAADVSSSAQGTRAADVYSAPTVTRSADVASMTGTNFSSWFNSAEGTVYAEADRSETTSTAQVWSISPAGSYGLRYAGAHTRLDRTQTAILITVNNSVSTSAKTSAALKTGSLAVSVNGGTPVNSSDSVVPPTATSLQLGNELGGSFLNGHIKRVAYYPKRLSNTELQGITA